MPFLDDVLTAYADFGPLALRVAIGAIFLYHGFGKFQMWNDAIPMKNLIRFLAFAEALGGLSVLLGFLTQFASIGLGIIMIGAIGLKTVKWKIPFSSHDKLGWEFDLIILAGCIALVFFGSGNMSLDAVYFPL